jgi:hypothetical protein
LLLLTTVGSLFLVDAQTPDIQSVKLRDGGGERVTPRIDAGYIEVQMLGSDGQPAGIPVSIPLRNQVAPEISATIKATQDGFQFEYQLRNGVSARQRINTGI